MLSGTRLRICLFVIFLSNLPVLLRCRVSAAKHLVRSQGRLKSIFTAQNMKCMVIIWLDLLSLSAGHFAIAYLALYITVAYTVHCTCTNLCCTPACALGSVVTASPDCFRNMCHPSPTSPKPSTRRCVLCPAVSIASTDCVVASFSKSCKANFLGQTIVATCMGYKHKCCAGQLF